MESTLSLAVTDLESEIGDFLGYGRGALAGDSAWDVRTQLQITALRNSGLRQFYYPPPPEGQEGSYDWSFLRPFVTLSLPANVDKTTPPGKTSLVSLPDDFGGFEGQIYVSDIGGSSYQPVPLVGPGLIQDEFARVPSITGRPKLAALVPIKGTTPTAGQRFALSVFPKSDGAYLVTFQYYVHPDALSGVMPYAYGGMAHAETILESCLAIAEQRRDDAMGVHTAKFMERLSASISHDRRNKPQLLGYNGDRSDQRAMIGLGNTRYWQNSPISVNGVIPGG